MVMCTRIFISLTLLINSERVNMRLGICTWHRGGISTKQFGGKHKKRNFVSCSSSNTITSFIDIDKVLKYE